MNLVLAMLDHQSKAVLFKPYYFNHLMALQMTGAEVIFSDCDAQLVPDMVRS
jgi:aspartate/methionine/tyrosine aminotransferase